MLQLVLECGQVLLQLDDAVANDLAGLAQLALILDVLGSKLSDADHFGEFGIAASADEACNLLPFGVRLELQTLHLCKLALVGIRIVLDLLRQRSKRLCERQHLGKVTKGPFGRIRKVFCRLRTSRRFAKIGEKAGTLVHVGAEDFQLLRENEVSLEEFALDAALADLDWLFRS